jgi:GMP synthase-like glutamine amidotransferase
MELCVLEHQADAPAGLLGEWAAERGHSLDVRSVPEIGEWPDPARYGAIVSLGSDRSVQRSRDPWIAPEVEYLRAAHEGGVPVLGLCFGGQALAAALGGEAHRAPAPEIGWHRLRDGGPVAPGPWFEWHEDAFRVPPGAEVLARDAAGGPQAFRAGASVGLQFHPEVTPAIVGWWVADGRAALSRNGLQAAEILRQTDALADEARGRAFRLFDAVAAGWPAGRPPSVQT